MLAATDPAQPYGAALPWPKREDAAPATRSAAARPGRVTHARRARRARRLRAGPLPGARRQSAAVARRRPTTRASRAALQALADHARAGRIRRIALEKVDGESVMGTPWEAALAEVGFRAGPRRLTLSA